MGRHSGRASRKSRGDTYDECVAAKRQARPTSTIPTSTENSPSPISLALADGRHSTKIKSPYIAGPDCESGDIKHHFLGDRRDSAFVCPQDPGISTTAKGMLGTNKKSDDEIVTECALRDDHKLRQRIVWGACLGSFAFLILVGLVMGLFFA